MGSGTGESWARYWRDGSRPLEAMHAHFLDHVYAPHSHETYSFGITDAGAQQFRCRGAAHTSGAGMVMLLNPDEVHDGHAAADLGYRYRIVHIGPELLREVLTDADDNRAAAGMPLFAQPVVTAPALADALGRLHLALARPADPLVRDERLTAAVTAIARLAAARAPRTRSLEGGAQRRTALRAREVIREGFLDQIAADELAATVGCSRFALYRAFRAEFGMAPSDYQRQLRLRHARSLLTAGTAPADAAVASGFADQAHFGRWFQRSYGITPGIFARATI